MYKQLDLTKPLFTRNGRSVSLICEERHRIFDPYVTTKPRVSKGTIGPLLMGLVRKKTSLNPHLLVADLCYWWPDGQVYRGVSGTLGRIMPSSEDHNLTNEAPPPPPRKRTVYYNVYKSEGDLYTSRLYLTRAEADAGVAVQTATGMTPRVGVVKVELVEGQYDE